MSRVALVRAVAAGAMDRAVDVAATLELRGYGGAVHQVGRRVRPWSRHDYAFVASAAVVSLLAVLGTPPFDAYPRLVVPVDAGVIGLSLALVVALLAPFADRRGIGS